LLLLLPELPLSLELPLSDLLSLESVLELLEDFSDAFSDGLRVVELLDRLSVT
jgi:hypothetical protein